MSVRGEDEEQKEKVRNEAGEFKKRNVEGKREKKFPIGQREHIRISMQSSMHLYNNSSSSLYLSSVSFESGT